MNFIFRLLLSFSASSWMIAVYVIKIHMSYGDLPDYLVPIACVVILIGISALSLKLTNMLSIETVCGFTRFDLADNEYLPVYLGYFFVALSISDWYTLFFIFGIVWVFTFFLNAYFNPIFLLFGYHYYQATTSTNTQLFIICRSTERNPENVKFSDLHRINNRTFISHREEK